MKGTFRDGKFSRCAEYPKGYPQCMGRASAPPEFDRCTCHNFTSEQMRFAREHGLTIEERADLPAEWRVRSHGFDSVLDELAHWKARAEVAECELAEAEAGIRRIRLLGLERTLNRPRPRM